MAKNHYSEPLKDRRENSAILTEMKNYRKGEIRGLMHKMNVLDG